MSFFVVEKLGIEESRWSLTISADGNMLKIMIPNADRSNHTP